MQQQSLSTEFDTLPRKPFLSLAVDDSQVVLAKVGSIDNSYSNVMVFDSLEAAEHHLFVRETVNGLEAHVIYNREKCAIIIYPGTDRKIELYAEHLFGYKG